MMSRQLEMEEYQKNSVEETYTQQANILNGMMKVEAIECSYKDLSMTFRFPVLEWQKNRVGLMHGGAICTAFDFSMAALARFCSITNWAPTVSLDVKYIRPIEVGDNLILKTEATATGKRIIQLTAKAFSENNGKLVATAASVYSSVDTNKDKK
ncbi:MAG: PaaI family thioesterase [Aminipila sp.]